MSEPGPSRHSDQRSSEDGTEAARMDGRSESSPLKRARRTDPDAASRSKRMFGLLNSTLTKAKEDNARRSSGEAGRRRAELEARTEEKRRRQDDRLKQTKDLKEQLRPLLKRYYALLVDLEADDAAVRLRKAQKRRLASFLITESDLSMYDGEQARRQSFDRRVIAPEITLTLEPIGRWHPDKLKRPDSHPIYYLPRQMLESQDDRLDRQEDKVDEEIDQVATAWEAEKARRIEEGEGLRRHIMAIKDKMVSLENEEISSGGTQS